MNRFGECGLCLKHPCTCNDPEPEAETHGISPTCPSCRATIYEGDLRLEDGDSVDVNCDRCGLLYRVRLVVSHDYYSLPIRAAERAEREKEESRG